MPYTPPDANQANFEFVIYVAPLGNEAHFDFTGAEVSERSSELTGYSLATGERSSELEGGGTMSQRSSELTGYEGITSERNSELIGQLLLPINRRYRILVKDENGDVLGEFDKFRALKFNRRLNNYGTCSFDIMATDPKNATLIALRKYTVYIYRVETTGDVLVWAGEQAMREGNLDNAGNNWCTIHCYDWLEQLNSRLTIYERTYVNMDQGEIAWNLIDESQRTPDTEVLLPGAAAQEGATGWNWSNLSDILTIGGGTHASAAGNTGGFTPTKYLVADEFGFAIPTGAIITGIKLDIYRQATQNQASPLRRAKDYSIKLMKVGSEVGDNKAAATIFTTDFVLATYGGQTDLWGVTWSPSDVNDDGFGARIAYQIADASGGTTSTNIDYMRITVYYLEMVVSSAYDFGIREGTIEATTNRDKVYHNDNIMEAIIGLANISSGFDFEITLDKIFNVATVIGTDRSNDIILEYGVNIASAKIVEDFVKPANRAIVLGNAIGEDELQRVEVDDATSQAAYKLREQRFSEMDEQELAAFTDRGTALLRKYKNPLMKVDIDLVKGSNPNITQFGLGDAVRLIIASGVYAIDSDYRVFEWEVSYPDDNTENLTLTLGNFTYD